jgi:hypothetical protein
VDWSTWVTVMDMGGTMGMLRLDELEREDMDWN